MEAIMAGTYSLKRFLQKTPGTEKHKFYRFDSFFGDIRTCSCMIEGKRKISWSVLKLKSENLPITDREIT